jgi:Amt family ammonium transporter
MGSLPTAGRFADPSEETDDGFPSGGGSPLEHFSLSGTSLSMSRSRAFLLLACALAAWSSLEASAGAQEIASADRPTITLEEVDQKVEAAALAGHNAWMLTSSALVLLMTAPGLAMFYSGLVRKKNVLGVMMQCIFLMALMTVMWALWGYSLAFGGDGAWVGNADYLFMNQVARTWNEQTGAADKPMEGAIPRLTHMLFQGMFFIITPALICGAFAERMNLTGFAGIWGGWG